MANGIIILLLITIIYLLLTAHSCEEDLQSEANELINRVRENSKKEQDELKKTIRDICNSTLTDSEKVSKIKKLLSR